jgi:hypothetical protein
VQTGVEDTLARIDGAVALARERAERAAACRDQLDALRVVGRCRDGTAEVTLGHTGALLDLHLGGGLGTASLERIASALLEANTTAQARLSARVAELTGQAFGEDSGTTREIAAHYRSMFPPPDRDDRGHGPASSGVLR